jgi:hypothetical protein
MARPNELGDDTVRITVRLPGELAGQLYDDSLLDEITMSEKLREILDWYYNDNTILIEEG